VIIRAIRQLPVLLFILFLVAPLGSSAQQTAPTFPTLPGDAPVGEGIIAECLEAVEGEAVCGRFRVYENRETREGRTIDLAFVVLKALDDRGNTDAVTYFNGGPGATVTAGARGFAGVHLRAERDLLLIDHRGTGDSGGLMCGGAYPGGVESRFGTVFPLDHLVNCRDALMKEADLSQYTTDRAMDDLAQLAAWLGYSALNLNGGSYGTREAQIFVRRHPEASRTVVLNAVAPIQDPLYIHHARFLEDALDNLFEECAGSAPCDSAFPDLRSVTEEVFAKVRAEPPVVLAEGKEVTFGFGDLSYAIRGLLYGQAGRLPSLLYSAHAGQWQEFADYYLGRQAWVGAERGTGTGYHFSVLCAEDVDRVSREDIASATRNTFMGDHLIGGYKDVCDLWPSARIPDSYFSPVVSDVPTLILSGGRDPVTPVAGGHKIAGQFSNSVHVIVPNGGHGQRSPCISSMILELVTSGSIEGLDVSCIEDAPPTRFVIP